MQNNSKTDFQKYQKTANRIRKTALNLIYKTRGPHVGSSFSCVEILVGLYMKFLNISSKNVQDPKRDRFIFSKGHASPALYAVLYEIGFLTKDDLDGFAVNGGIFEQHPNMNLAKGIEVSSGSLGHGLSIGVGMALAAKKDGKNYRTCVLISDGELNEGSIWEAVLFSAQHKLSNLLLVVDYNKMQALGFTKDTLELDPLMAKFEAFGWGCVEVDGHNFPSIIEALEKFPFQNNKPSVIIAHTVKGKGVSFMENSLHWHYACPNENECSLALDELSKNMI